MEMTPQVMKLVPQWPWKHKPAKNITFCTYKFLNLFYSGGLTLTPQIISNTNASPTKTTLIKVFLFQNHPT